MKGRKRRIIQWEEIMGRKAWTASELAQKIGLSMRACRRYLVMSFNSGRLIRKPFGRYLYYAIARFCEPPDFYFDCPRCLSRMDVYKRKCGCVFQICNTVFSHSIFKYCALHGHANNMREEKGGEH